MNKKLLDVKNLCTYYRSKAGMVRAVDDVSFFVNRNEVFGIAGESGCGKSTLARALLKLVEPPCYIQNGEVFFDGINLFDLDEERMRKIRWNRISYIPQSAMNSLNPVMTIEDQITDVIRTHEKISEEDAKKRIPLLLKSVGLAEDVASMYPHELSGGMKQRVIVAMSIVLNPELIIADEPTTALDVNVQRVVLQTLVKQKDELGASLIIITHDMAVLAQVVDRLGIMYAGKIMEIGSVNQIFSEPLHPYTEGLMSAIPSIAEKRVIKGIPGYPPKLVNPPKGCRFHPRCPYATEKCSQEEPKLISLNSDRFVACHKIGDKI